MTGQNVAYIRVSTSNQNTDRQLDGMTFDRTFEDKASGGTTDRPELHRCLAHLRDGDTLHVHSIDRLARNLADLQAIVEELTSKGVAVRFHKENLGFDGSNSAMQKLMLQMMGAFAEFERSLIRERQREGIATAKAKGKKWGAPSKLTHEQREEIRTRVAAGENKSALAKEFSLSRPTLYASLSDD